MSDSPSPLGRWLPAIAWAAVIFVASTRYGSGEHTRALLVWLFPTAENGTLDVMHFVLRKLGHFVEYLVFGLLLVRAIAGGAPWRMVHVVRAIGIAALYAASDELHQHFVPGRVAAVNDVLIDAAGAATGQILIVVRRAVLR